ncbi:hypothetical protein WDU94_008190 [Cyamophila willieti]
MSCMRLQVRSTEEPAAGSQNFRLWSYYDYAVDNDFGLRLDLESSRLSFVTLDGHGADVEVKQITDGKEHYLCFAWREEKKMWKLFIDGKKVKSGTLHKDVEVENHDKELVNENQLDKYNLVFYRNIDDNTKDLSTLADPDVLSSNDLPVFKMLDVSFEEKDSKKKQGDSSSSQSSESKESDEKVSGNKSKGKGTVAATIDILGRYIKNKDIHVIKFQRGDTDSDESLESAEIKSRHTRSEKSTLSNDADVMLSDQPKKEVVEETLTKKTATKDQFALSDILDQGNINKIKDFGSKFDPSFNSKIDSFFNRNGGGSPASSNSGSTGGLGGLGSLGGLGNLGSFGGFGGGGGSGGGMPNLGSLASAFGGGNGGSSGLNFNQFLSGSNGLSNLFKSGDKTPQSPSNPSYPSYPSSNPANPPPYNPNYPPAPQSSGSLYPTLPKDPQPAVPLSNPTNSYSNNNNNNNNNKGSVSLSDILGGFGGGVGGTRLGDKAEPNKGPGYDISFGEIFGFGGNKNKNNNPNYPENNHRPTSGGVSLKDILGFGGSKKDESKNSYVPSYGTIGGGLEPSKTRPKNNFDEISEGLGLNVNPDPIVRNNKPIVVLNQPNQKSSLTESARGSTALNSQRINTNSYASRKPANEKSLADIQRAIEEDIIQPTKAKKTRRDVNPRGSSKYQQRDGDETAFNFNKFAKDIAE